MGVMTPAETSSQQLNVPKPGRYRIHAEATTVTIRTRHLFGLGPVRATLALRDGLIQVAAPVEASTVHARFAASTFRSGNGARDAAVLSPKLLDAEAYPSLTFTATELTEADGRWSLRGELEVRGVTRLVEVRLSAVSEDEGTLRATAQVTVDRYDFGLTAYRGLAARRLTVSVDITAHRESES
jgi:polyisoprenoid-binding protein YceI